MGKFSAFLPLRGRIAEDSDPYTFHRELRDKLEYIILNKKSHGSLGAVALDIMLRG